MQIFLLIEYYKSNFTAKFSNWTFLKIKKILYALLSFAIKPAIYLEFNITINYTSVY